jgi:hypothetical protein
MLISREAVRDFMSRDLDDHRWLKRLSRERIMRELSHLRVPPRFKTQPWLHQLVCFYLGLLHPRFLFLLDMGGGKTKVVADLYTQRLREGKADRGLVAVPRFVNIGSWARNLAEHSDLEMNAVDCESVEEKWERIMHARGELTVVDASGVMLALSEKVRRRRRKKGEPENQLVADKEKIRLLLQRYNFLAVDEVHKVGANHNSLPFDILDRVSAGCDYAYALTGTLFGKHPEAAWGPFYLIDRGETLGPNLGPFRGAFFDVDADGFAIRYQFRKEMAEDLNRVLQHRSIRYDEHEMDLGVPRMIPRERVVELGREARDHYMRALEGLINAGGDARELDGAYIRMRQIAAGYLAFDDADGKRQVIRFKENQKLDFLVGDVEDAGDSKVVVVHWYRETGQMLVDRLRQEGHEVLWLYGGTKDVGRLMEQMLDPRGPRVLVMQADVGGTGTDGLQDVARYVFMYETPTSPTTRVQTERRVRRPGQKWRSFCYDYVARRTCDRGILEDLKEGIDTHDAVMRGRRSPRGFFLGG